MGKKFLLSGMFKLFFFYLFVSTHGLASIPDAKLVIQGSDLVNGRSVQFALSGAGVKKTTVLLFISAKCPCSRSHHAVLKNLAQEFSGVQFFGIVSNADETASVEDQKIAREYFSQIAFPFPILADQSAAIANQLKAYKTPHAFVFSGDRLVFQGGVDDRADAAQATRHYLKAALTDLRAGREVQQGEVRVLGCEIRRGSSK